MDERFRNENDNTNRPPSQRGNDTVRRNSSAGDFKVSLPDEANPQRSTVQRGGAGQSRDNFKVSIPQQNDGSSVPRRPTPPSSLQNRKAAQRPSAQGFGGRTASQPGARAGQQRPQSAQNRQRSASPSQNAARRPSQASPQRRRPTPEQLKRAEQARKQREKQAKKAEKAAKKKASKEGNLTPQQRALKKQARRYNTTKGMLILVVSLIFVAIITTTLSTIALGTINDILAINKTGGTTVSVSIPEKATFDDVFNALSDSGLIKQKFFCKLFCKFRHYDQYYSKAQKKDVPVEYEAGVYYFETDDGLETMLESIKAAKTNSKETVRLTFPEGWTVAQIFEKIEKYNVCTAEKLYANLDIIGNQFDFYKNIKSGNGRYLKAEGYLFPDTYDFYIDESASSVIKKLFGNYEQKWTGEMKQKAKDLGYSQDQIMIIASIIQREAKDKSQMADIASVIYNRLADPATYPLLDMNSTKDYITSTNEYGVFTDFYYNLYLSSYNTYSAEGLPPGAICNPGIEAINAALNPNTTNYHFFCHDSNGNIYLAETAAEHKINTEKILYESD